jgi:hypothetical protein
MECASGSFWHRTSCILTYEGSRRDIWINYSMLAVNLAAGILGLWLQAPLTETTMSPLLSEPEPIRGERNTVLMSPVSSPASAKRTKCIAAVCSLAFVCVFQVLLCLAVGCSGVSIIWCACTGWIVSDRVCFLQDSTRRFSFLEGTVVFCLSPLAIAYYAATFPFITTGAHCCALALGGLLAMASRYAVKFFHCSAVGDCSDAGTGHSYGSQPSEGATNGLPESHRDS